MPFIVGVTGYATSGKDTFADGLVEEFGFKSVGFADALRNDIGILDPIVGVNDRDLSWVRASDCLRDYTRSKARYPEFRRLLQVYGTEVHRFLDEDYWVRRLGDWIHTDDAPGYVVTDMRFPNERHGLPYNATVRIDRPGVGPINGHESEEHVAKMSVDYTVTNNSSVEDLQDTAVQIVRPIYNNYIQSSGIQGTLDL